MAELVGLVASIAGLIHITGSIAGFCCTYIGTQSDANKDIKRLCDELTDLSKVITNLYSLATGADPPVKKLVELKYSLQACNIELIDLSDQLQKIKKDIRGAFYRGTWPHKE